MSKPQSDPTIHVFTDQFSDALEVDLEYADEGLIFISGTFGRFGVRSVMFERKDVETFHALLGRVLEEMPG